MAKIIITGSMGLIGSEITRYLKETYTIHELDIKWDMI